MKPFCTINGIPTPDYSAAFEEGYFLNEQQLKEMRVRMGENFGAASIDVEGAGPQKNSKGSAGCESEAGSVKQEQDWPS